jgi:hypothetical protein
MSRATASLSVEESLFLIHAATGVRDENLEGGLWRRRKTQGGT